MGCSITTRALIKSIIESAGYDVSAARDGAEALRLLQEGVASPEQVDRIVRLGGGFRMGPFELMDLVGIDVGFEVSKSFWEQSFHEPRWRPSQLVGRAAR